MIQIHHVLGRTLIGLSLLAACLHAPMSWGGIENPGFETQGDEEYPVPDWTVIGSDVDRVAEVEAEDGDSFEVYDEMGISVVPNRQAYMLAVGTPKLDSENQNTGTFGVEQRFPSTSSRVVFATRLFSFEFRGDDVVSFNIVDPQHPSDTFDVHNVLDPDSPLEIPMPRGPALQCATTPCNLVIDVGRRNDFLDTSLAEGLVNQAGWMEIEVNGLPTDGRELIFTFEIVTAGGNSAHGTWAYLDNVPLKADFTFNPPSPLEADYVFFQNQSLGDPTSFTWTFTGVVGVPDPANPGQFLFNPFSTETHQENTPFAWPEDSTQGTATAKLTISDGVESDSIEKDIPIGNANPKVHALSLEVQEGHKGGLVCRHLDPGIYDQASYSLDQATPGSVRVVQEHDPTLTTGLAIGEFDATDVAPGAVTGGWTCTVTDDEEGSGYDPASIQVLSDPEVTNRDEPANDACVDGDGVAGATLQAGGRYVYAIDTPGELDCFEIKREGGGDLQGNDQVGLLLTDLPADYELVVASLGTSGAGDLEVSPYFTSPYFPSPYFPSPYFPSPYFPSPYFPSELNSSPYFPSPYFPSPYFPSPYFPSPITESPYFPSEYSWFPLTQVANLTIGLNNITGKDVSVAELGLDSIADEGLTVKTFSAAPFNLDEQITLSVSPGERLFAIVKAREGSAPGPYTLQVEASQQMPLDTIMGANCQGEPVVPPEDATTSAQVLHNSGGDTLILTPPPQRFVNLRNEDISVWNDEVLPALVRYLDGTTTKPSPVGGGKIIALPSNIYDERDRHPCDTELSNQVAQDAADIVKTEREANPNLHYVIVVGTDEDVPFLAHIDRTAIGNASEYQEAFILPGAQLAKINEGLMDTDAHLCGNSVPFQGGKWFIPDCIVARFVESADDIVNAVDTFLANPQIDLSGRIHTDAYDFLSDGASAVADTLDTISGTPVDRMIDDPTNDNDPSGDPDVWDANDARCRVLGIGDANHTDCSVPDLSYINGHMTHSVWLAALGFKTHDFTDIVTSLEVVNPFDHKAVLSVGCHFALSVADRLGYSAAAGLPWDSGIDWMQRIVGGGGAAIGSTDFGLGESEGIAGHEELMVDIANEIAGGAETIGDAWLGGIHSFVLRQFDPSEYHQKVVETTTLYGPPHYQFTLGSATQAIAAVASLTATTTAAVACGNSDGEGTSDVTIDGSLHPHTLTKVCVEKGEYLSADPGGFSAAVGNALQPRDSVGLSPENSEIAKGVLITGGNVQDFDGWNPVIATRDYDWNADSPEPLVCKSSFSPAIPAWINTVPQGNDFIQAANVSMGQFRCTDPNDPDRLGVERVWTDMQLKTERCSDTQDFVPPHVTSQLLHVVNGTDDVELTLDASDDSGIKLINVLVVRPDGTVEAFEDDVSGESSPYTISLTNARDQEIFWQVEDNNCNVFNGTFKGLFATAIEVDASSDGGYVPEEPETLTATITDFTSIKNDQPTFLWSFGDGTSLGGLLNSANPDIKTFDDSAGDLTFTVEHTYSATAPSPLTATLIIATGAGGSGTDSTTLVRLCDGIGDGQPADADLTGCSFKRISDTQAEAILFVDGEISGEFQYRTRVNSVLMKWQDGKVTGPNSLVVTPVGTNGLRFVFDLDDVGWDGVSDILVDWHTQSGQKGKKAVGFPDDMPNEGSFSYSLE